MAPGFCDPGPASGRKRAYGGQGRAWQDPNQSSSSRATSSGVAGGPGTA
jgi:hypothetical protein